MLNPKILAFDLIPNLTRYSYWYHHQLEWSEVLRIPREGHSVEYRGKFNYQGLKLFAVLEVRFAKCSKYLEMRKLKKCSFNY